MLSGWSIFLLLQYSTLFFASLMFRKQWIEREALAFPLAQLPLQMVEVEKNAVLTCFQRGAFWRNGMMWCGFGLAFVTALFQLGMFGQLSRSWPGNVPVEWKPVWPRLDFLSSGCAPGMRVGSLPRLHLFGGIGIALPADPRSIVLFLVLFLFSPASELVLAEMIGAFPRRWAACRNQSASAGQPAFLVYQAVGGWATMMAVMLVWMARDYLRVLFREAFGKNKTDEDEPFSARTMVFGFLLSFAGLIAWSWFAGINVFMAIVFMGIFLMTSLVIDAHGDRRRLLCSRNRQGRATRWNG